MALETVLRGKDERCTCSARDVVNTLLTAEHLMVAFYYTGLTSPQVMHNRALGGPSADPNNPGLPPGGAPSNVRFLQAALDAEVKHAASLTSAGAVSPYAGFYFPPSTFRYMGTTGEHGSFLGVMEILETMCEGAYIAALREFLRLGYPNLATVAGQIMGVESEHRTLGRTIARVSPPNNLTLVKEPFHCIGDVATALRPFLTGRRYLFAPDATRAIALPTEAQTTRVVGKYGTRQVRTFLWM